MRRSRHPIELVAEGERVTLSRGGVRLAELGFVLPGEPPPGWVPDGSDAALRVAGSVRVRLTASRQTIAVSLDNLADAPAKPGPVGMAVVLPPGVSGWSCCLDHRGWLAAVGPEGGVLIELDEGFLRQLPPQQLFPEAPTDRAAFQLADPDADVGASRQIVTRLRATPLDRWSDAGARLPAWLPAATAVPAHTEVVLALADRACAAAEGVRVETSDLSTVVSAAAGHHLIRVHGPGPSDRVLLSWGPEWATLVGSLTDALIRRSPGSDAAGVVVADALAVGAVAEPERALDWLERVDWVARDTPLAAATAVQLAGLQGDRALLSAAIASLVRQPAGRGSGLLAMRAWWTSLSLTGEPSSDAAALLHRPPADPEAALELALLTDPDAARPGVERLVDRLGGGLPGRPLALDATAAAWSIAMLRVAPEGWRGRAASVAAADHVERLLLAEFADAASSGRALDALAWLAVGRLGN